jgi:hypothetical protein
MRYVIWTIRLLIVALLVGVLNYTLPDRDVVRIVETEVRRIDFGENSLFWAQPDIGQAQTASRDVRFVNTVRPNGNVMVYRNEDTGWGWPPYFKLDSSNLQTELADLVSTASDPQWVVLTHYGWRAEIFSAFPNAVAVRPVDSPEVRLIPYLNIAILVSLALLAAYLWRLWDRFHERRIEPVVDHVTIALENADARADSFRERIWAWLGRRTGRQGKK